MEFSYNSIKINIYFWTIPYADLIKQLDKIYKESFAKKDDSKLYVIVDSVEDAIRYIESRDSSDSQRYDSWGRKRISQYL